jgi:hypothetical protein
LRSRRVLRERKNTPEVRDVLDWIEDAHVHAQRALAGDESASFEHSHLAWAKTALFAPSDPLRARPERHATKSGALRGFGKYEEFDPGWLETLAEYLEHLAVKKPKFGVAPQCVDVASESFTLAVAGDWAAGYWLGEQTPAAKIAGLMSSADYTIHLGDTYYAGTQKQVSEHLTAKWPRGRVDGFAVPGNHEMYTKAWPLMEALAARFPSQRGTTFFALRNPYWLVLALDTSYFASGMYLDGSLGPETVRRHWLGRKRPNPQREFMRQQLARCGKRRVMLFTHHPPYALTGPSKHDGDKKYEWARDVLEIFTASGLPSGPDYWAWGHIHATAVYRHVPGTFRGRLIGHGAIPFGASSALAKEKAKHDGRVVWYESVPVETGGQRMPNGYLRLELDRAKAREALIGENGDVRWSCEL